VNDTGQRRSDPTETWSNIMRTTTLIATVLLIACTGVRAGSPDIPDDINARLARSKTQAATQAAGQASSAISVSGISAVGGAGGCNIAIGNVFEDKKPGAISTSAKRETTVIVTGDVIQVGNNCR
jgi:hypothetical protein